MSCMIQKPENTMQIAEYIAGLLNMGYNYFGMDAPEELREALSDCGDIHGFFSEEKIYIKLVELNRAAYNGRYDHPVYDTWIMPFKSHNVYKPHEWKDGHYVLDNWHFKIFAMIQFFNYQCGEDATYDTPLYKAMNTLKNRLALFIVTNTEEYSAQAWE